MAKQNFLSLDVGERRIGVSVADSSIKIAIAYETITVDGNELRRIAEIIAYENIDVVVIGYPRNQSGEPTRQTEYVEEFAKQLVDIAPKIVFQDESLTSVKAEETLKRQGKPFVKGDIDALAASFILEDYLERH